MIVARQTLRTQSKCPRCSQLHLAAVDGLTKVCEAVLQQGFVAAGARDRRGQSASEYAEKHGHWDLAQILREQGSLRSGNVTNSPGVFFVSLTFFPQVGN